MQDVGILYVHLVHFTAIWYILWSFGHMVIWYILVYRTMKNLATLWLTAFLRISYQ
jgi:hypothetical protein